MALPEILQNLRIPLIGSPMFIVSTPDLVIAQCKAGIVGSFPALNARPEHVLHEWLDRITTELGEYNEQNPDRPAAPFAVNQIVHRSNNRLDHDVEACVKFKVPIVITSLGARPELNEAIHSYGGITMHDVIDIRFSQKALEKGADGLIAVCSGAGGHAGRLSPFALIQEIREFFDGPVALSGSISTGGAIAAAKAMGADLGYIGSAFISCHEANAVDSYKDMIVESKASDIVYTNLFTGVHGNYLKPSIANAGLDPNNLPESDPSKMNFGSGGDQESKAWKDIWGCGQGIGAVTSRMSVGEYVDQLEAEYRASIEKLVAGLNG
ncbi:MAG: nitronate monooxygenase [Hellea sp.]|nr:nitronate monooxygenase [Hellea sp.]